ncbi:hypothetical protein TSUD_114660 [Trifolium subterraneum]|uniref:Uncharacterized protein n=1 Tax=Trifolium subterraneum TaxID=3900 RepID=A0A2Z6N7K3_TRISU|nr:hypothetical protein TSUD_114660 [Trifolium subterraneum]
MKQPITQPLIPQPPNLPANKFTIGNLATISFYHMFILIVLFLAVRQPEFFEYGKALFSMIAVFEVIFGLAFLNSIPDSNKYSAVQFSGLFISNGVVANNIIYMINHHLFWGTAIWWLFCFLIAVAIIGKDLTSKVCCCCLSELNKPTPTGKVPPLQNTIPAPTVIVTVSPRKLP